MDSLPQELIENIVLHADPEARSNLLTVSRVFQIAVERRQMGCIRPLKSSSIERFLSIYRGYRAQFVHEIFFAVTFPELKDTEEEPLKCRESLEDLRHNNEKFSEQIFDLFRALQTLEAEQNYRPRGIKVTIHISRQEDDEDLPCHHRRYNGWRLHLLNHENLPEIPSIRTLRFEPFDNYHLEGLKPVDLSVIPNLAFKLPNLETLECPHLWERFPYCYPFDVWKHYRHPWEGPMRDSRRNFAQTVGFRRHSKLENMALHFFRKFDGGSIMDQSVPLADIPYPALHDPLSTSIRNFSQSLTTLDLRIIADSTLFWPPFARTDALVDTTSEIPTVLPPSWPNLKRISVEFHPSTPKGTWYFCGPRGEGTNPDTYTINEKDHYPPLERTELDQEWDNSWNFRDEDAAPNEFRIKPIRSAIEPLFGAFARALARMPVLEEARLFASLQWDPEDEEEYEGLVPFGTEEKSLHRWGVRYLPASSREGRRKAKIEWEVGEWRPSEELMELFRDVSRAGDWSGKGNWEEELEVVWKDIVLLNNR